MGEEDAGHAGVHGAHDQGDHLVAEHVDARNLGRQFLLADGDHVSAVPGSHEIGQEDDRQRIDDDDGGQGGFVGHPWPAARTAENLNIVE